MFNIPRRKFLRGTAGLAVAPMWVNTLMAHETTTNSSAIVVVIYLSGGNDGLNTVIPLTQLKPYTTLRTPGTAPPGQALAYTAAQLAPTSFGTTPTSTTLDYAFAPSMTAMSTLYAGGHLAVIAGVSLPITEHNSLSHYNATQDWMTGKINISGVVPPGWVGAALDGSGSTLGPVASLSGTSLLINSASATGLVLSTPLKYFGPNYGVSDNQTDLIKAYKTLVQYPAANATYGFQQTAAEQALAAVTTVQSISKHIPANDYPFQKNAPWLDYQLQDVAQLIVGGSGIRGFFVEQGGYDTHSQQALSQPILLAQLSNSMANFYGYLQTKGVSSNVLIMTISDFGRTPHANQNWGTDHGSSTISFALGDMVTGGLYGSYPSLKNFDVNGNFQVKVDFRNVLSDVITYTSGASVAAAVVAPYTTPGPLGFV